MMPEMTLRRFVLAGLTLGYGLGALGCSVPAEKRFQHHIEYLASDELEGRGIGSKGIELAADYIATQFRRAGLDPMGDKGTYFQTLTMPLERKLLPQTHLAFTPGGTPLVLGRDFTPFSFSSGDSFAGDVVFCGYGIVDGDRSVDDFVHVDLKDKIALIFRGEPPKFADEQGNQTRHAMLRNKVYNAKDRGAVAVLLVNPPGFEEGIDELVPFEQRLADSYGVPAFHVLRSTVEPLLAAAGLGDLAGLKAKLDEGAYISAGLKDVRAEGQAAFQIIEAPTRNVVGILRGEGSLAEEAVIIGAHYDHLGLRPPMRRKFEGGKLVSQALAPEIHNGADDNASGVSGLIEIARELNSGPKPARSVIFVAFTAEETGLQGSTYFMKHMPVAAERVVAMLNMDMIGRMPAGKSNVTVFGTKTGSSFMEILEPRAKELGLEIGATPDAGGSSDHAVFVRSKIPSLHFFTGHHPQYHDPADDAELINAEGGSRVARLVAAVGRDIADRPDRPTYEQVQAKGESQVAGTPSFRVVMGLTPGYVDDGQPGMKVEAVNPNGPADLAGLKAEDRITRIGGKNVANIYDYMAATRENKAGDVVEVVVLREGKEHVLSVTLSAAR